MYLSDVDVEIRNACGIKHVDIFVETHVFVMNLI